MKINQSGASLVEILMVIATVGILVALIANLPPSIGLIGRSHHQSLAREIAVKQIEDKRSTAYENLAIGETPMTDSRLTLLPSGSDKVVVAICDETICTQSEDMKEITVTVTWKEASKAQEVKIKTLVAEGGLN